MSLRWWGPVAPVWVAIVAWLPAALAAQAPSPKKLSASIDRIYGGGARTDTVVIEADSLLRITRHDSLLGYAAIGNARGKDQPITYLVATDSTLRLKDIDILAYRESYGGEVAYEPWRRQFRGKSPTDTLEVNRQIRGISGATISVNAVTAGVRWQLARFLRLREGGRL